MNTECLTDREKMLLLIAVDELTMTEKLADQMTEEEFNHTMSLIKDVYDYKNEEDGITMYESMLNDIKDIRTQLVEEVSMKSEK